MNHDHSSQLDNQKLIQNLKSRNSRLLPKLREVHDKVVPLLNNRIQSVFEHYTLHNIDHSYRVMEYMASLVVDLDKLSELEIAILAYSALLHDIGMAPSDDTISSIKNGSMCINGYLFSHFLNFYSNDESLALQEYIRKFHSILSKKFVNDEISNMLHIDSAPSLSYSENLGLICESHTEDYDWIKSNLRIDDTLGQFDYNAQYIAVVLRLADILDIDNQRTPQALYDYLSPSEFSNMEWNKHFSIQNADKVKVNERNQSLIVQFKGTCKSAKVHRKLLEYFSWVEDELFGAVSLTQHMSDKYILDINPKPDVIIRTTGYTFSDYRMSLNYRAISSLLMGERIYGDKQLGLRELLQNSLDSCRIRAKLANNNDGYNQDEYIPKITIVLDRANGKVTIKDNGTGMSREIIKKYFLNIGVSFYTSSNFLLKDSLYKPIGNYGIGFLSCFMLSDKVAVVTREMNSRYKYRVELEMGDEYCSLTETEDVLFQGTEVVLDYNQFMSVFNHNEEMVERFVQTHFITDNVNFSLVSFDSSKDAKIVNSLKQPSLQEKNTYVVDFSNYLKDISGYAVIKKKVPFVRKIDDIRVHGDLYHYTPDAGILEVTEESHVSIDEYLHEDTLLYLSIPIVDQDLEREYQSALNIFDDDLDEVIDKLDSKLKWIAVLVPKDVDVSGLDHDEITQYSEILEGFDMSSLAEIGHCRNFTTKVFVKRVYLYEGVAQSLYVPFETDSKKRFKFANIFSRDVRAQIYVRGVLLKDYGLDWSISASLFEVRKVVANIESRNVIPNISRNNVDNDSSLLLNYAFCKAIHLGAIDVLEVDQAEKDVLRRFVKKYFDSRSDYEI